MMYTPSPVARRPRPPGTIIRGKQSLNSKSAETPTNSLPGMSLSHSLATVLSTASFHPHPTSSGYAKRRQELSQSELSRISASPSEAGDVSFGLDLGDEWEADEVAEAKVDFNHIPTALSVPTQLEDEAVPSPPPPYGQELPAETSDTGPVVATPPRTSIPSRRAATSPMMPSRSKTEERLRDRRAKDAAKSIGLDMDFGEGTDLETDRDENASGSGSEMEDLTPKEVRRRLREMRRTIKRRENELRMAAHIADKALRQHEQVVVFLPSSIKERMPQLVNLISVASPTSRRGSKGFTPSSHLMHSRASSGSSMTPSKPRQPPSLAMYSPSLHPRISTSTTNSADGSSSSAAFRDHTLDSSGDFSSPDPSRPFQTLPLGIDPQSFSLHQRKASRSKLFSYHPNPAFRLSNESSPRRTQLLASRQAEDDERILALEAALTDAREGEQAQTRLAARLRRDYDKLQREFDRTEERMDHDLAAKLGLKVGVARNISQQPWRTRDRTIDKDLREEYLLAREERLNKVLGDTIRAGDTAFAHSADSSAAVSESKLPGELSDDLEAITERLGRISVDTMPPPGVPYQATHGTAKLRVSSSQLASPQFTGSASRHTIHQLGLPLEAKKVRKKVSQSSFASPAPVSGLPQTRSSSISPLSESIRQGTAKQPGVESSKSGYSARSLRFLGGGSHDNTVARSNLSTGHRNSAVRSKLPSLRSLLIGVQGPSSIRGLPYSPQPRLSRFGPSPLRPHSHSQTSSIVPDFASLSSRMASMRAYVSSNLPSSSDLFNTGTGGRTLGSELGIGFGEDWADPLDSCAETRRRSNLSGARGSDGEEDEEGDDGSIVYQSAAPLPPSVSAALSSLADVLAPTSIFASAGSYLPIGPSAINSALDYTSFEVLEQVVRVRQIKWADGVPPSSTLSGMTSTLGINSISSASKQSAIDPPTQDTDVGETSDHPQRASLTAANLRLRPKLDKRSSSNGTDGSFALAHRRRTSQPPAGLAKKDDIEREPTTIPGKVVNDLLYWLVVLVEWIEWAVVLMVKIAVILRYGKRGRMQWELGQDEETEAILSLSVRR